MLAIAGAVGCCLLGSASAATVGDNAEQPRLSRTAAMSWLALHGIAKVCPAFPDEGERLAKLDQVVLSTGQNSVKQFVNALESDPKRKASLDKDVRLIVQTAGGCDTDALREWQADGWRVIDTNTQLLAAHGGSIVVNWPTPALLEPIHVSVERRGHDAQGREYLMLSLRNPSKDAIGVALSGKALHAGLCPDPTSMELPITQQSNRAAKVARLASGESLQAKLIQRRLL